MGIKSLFFEEVDEPNDDIDLSELASGLDTPEEEVEVADVNLGRDNVVLEIYSANDLSDLDKSIFKVEDLMKTLPAEMPTAAKRSTVESIMNTVGLDVASTIEDGTTRINILNASLNKTIEAVNADIEGAQDKIEQLKIEIANNEKLIADSKATIKDFTQDVNVEVERIQNLINFIGGE